MGFKYFLPVKDELNGIFYGRNKNKITFYFTSSAPQIVTSGLVLNLDAGDSSSYPGSGTTWTDLSGNGNNATLINGPTYSSAYGGSIVFDGTDDYVSLSNVQPGTNDFTISVWVYKNNNTSNDYVWDFGANGGTLSAGTSIGGYGFRYYNATLGTSSNMYTQGTIPNVSEWYEVTITRNSGTSTMYVNAQSITSSSGDTHNISSTTLYIGRYGGGTGYEHDGRISNFKIYNRALTASEVAQNYNALKDRFVATVVTSGLVLNLDAGDSSSYPGSGTTWTDLSGNGNNATLINGPTYSSANGGSIVFDGTDDYAALGSGSLVNGLTDITLEVWFKADSTGTNRGLIYGDTNDSLSYDNGCSLRYDSAGSWGGGTNLIKTGFGQNGASNVSSSANAIESSSNIQFTDWTCITVTADVGSSISLYKNGQLDTPTYSISNKETSISNCTNFVIGKDGGGSSGGNYWDGSISIVRVYNRVLSASEVQQNYDALKDRFAAPVVTSGLQLYLDAGNSSSYPGSGTTWYDLSGNNNNGTLVNGPTYSSANGGSIVFDGTDDLVTTTLTSGTSFTWCCWFKTDVLSNGYRNIISIRVNNYMLVLLDDNTNYLGFWSPDAFTNGSTLNTPQLSTNTWYFVTFVREGNNVTSGYKAYLNGSFSGSANTGTWSSSDPIILGGRTDYAQYLNGNISNVQIYNRALSAAEVTQNYNAFKSRYGL